MPHRRSLVLCQENAQLGNRLMVYAHLLAAARERGWSLINPTFEPYADLFVGTSSRPHGRSVFAVRCAWQTGKILAPLSAGRVARARARGAREVDLETVVPAAEASHARWLLLQGFRIRCPQWVARQATGLRTFFTPIDIHRQPAETLIAALRQRAEVVVGVHIRQGDYAQHLGGRYFYTMLQYADLMRKTQQLLAPRTVAFVICTHVPLPSAVFTEFAWAPGPGHMAADLQALSGCDFILGPPSSFSAWAAFYGAARLLRVTCVEQSFTLDDFTLESFPETRD